MKIFGLTTLGLRILLGVALCLIFSVVAFQLVEERAFLMKRASSEAASLSAVIAKDIERNIEIYDLSVQGVIEDLRDPEAMAASQKLRQLILFDRAAKAKFLGAILVIDSSGKVVIDSRSLELPPYNYADREYFKAQAASPKIGLYVSQPLISKSEGKRIFALSRRINNADGSFGGVVVGTIYLDYLHDLFSKAGIGPGMSLSLFRGDGTLMMREPYETDLIGKVVKPVTLLAKLAQAPEGEYQTHSVFDHVERLFHYHQINDLPLVQTVALSLDGIYLQWWRKAVVYTSVLLFCCAIIIALAFGLNGELRRRSIAEESLAHLARVDGLTGISNRRHFDEVLESEWGVACRHRSPLSLLMIDADNFKAYNDTYGHPAGDAILKAIGECLAANIRRPGDVAARYGGEEFAVILPRTTAEGAFALAEKIRIAIEKVSTMHSGPLSVSIGVASVVPGAGSRSVELLQAADTALYESKSSGRNKSTLHISPVGPDVFDMLKRA